MRKKIVTCAVTLTIMAGIFCFPAHGHTATESQGQAEQQKTAVPRPAAPIGVKSKALNSETIKLTWKKASGASGYEIYRYSFKKKTYRKIGTTSKTSFKSRGLRADTRYRYKIRTVIKQDGKAYYTEKRRSEGRREGKKKDRRQLQSGRVGAKGL